MGQHNLGGSATGSSDSYHSDDDDGGKDALVHLGNRYAVQV